MAHAHTHYRNAPKRLYIHYEIHSAHGVGKNQLNCTHIGTVCTDKRFVK